MNKYEVILNTPPGYAMNNSEIFISKAEHFEVSNSGALIFWGKHPKQHAWVQLNTIASGWWSVVRLVKEDK